MNVLMKGERKKDISLLLCNKLMLGFLITTCYGLKLVCSHQVLLVFNSPLY